MAINNIPGVGPTNADIATAVAAPSSATIASAVAAAVPTIGAINSAVSTNASPFGGTWAQLGVLSPSSGTSASISGLGSYKFLRFKFAIKPSSGSVLYLRFNNDTAQNYRYGYLAWNGQTQNGERSLSTQIGLQINEQFNSGNFIVGMFEIFQNNSINYKDISWKIFGTTAYLGHQIIEGIGLYNSTSVIDSIQLNPSASFNNDGTSRIYVEGAN